MEPHLLTRAGRLLPQPTITMPPLPSILSNTSFTSSLSRYQTPSTMCAAFILFMLLCVAPALATLQPADYLALQSLRRSLFDLPGSAFFASWDFTADPCAFAGVLCSGDRVVALSLGDPRAGAPGLAGRLSDALARLTALAELSLVPGRVAGPLPSAFPPDLRFLALAGNLFSGPVPDSIAGLRFLRTLDLSDNLLAGQIPDGVFQLPALQTLVLTHNRLSGRIPASVSAPLLRFDLKNNALSGEVPTLPFSLQYLSLARNQLSGPVDRVLAQLNHLNYLDLSVNRLSGPVPGVIFTFPISILRLQQNQFSGPLRPAGQLAVAGATVDLSHNRLMGAVPADLAPAGRLYLNVNHFTGEVPPALVRQVASGTMRVLYLQHNFLTGFPLGASAAVPTGSSVCLRYNCMVPPPGSTCPRNPSRQKARPSDQCATAPSDN